MNCVKWCVMPLDGFPSHREKPVYSKPNTTDLQRTGIFDRIFKSGRLELTYITLFKLGAVKSQNKGDGLNRSPWEHDW